MLSHIALARLRAQAPRSSARDISRQLAQTYLTSTIATTKLAIVPAFNVFRSYATATKTKPKPKSKSKLATKKAPAKKTATRKTAAKKPVKKVVKKKAVKKPVRKIAAKKAVKKAAPKRKPLTERQKLLRDKAKVRENIAQLKVAALTEPKRLPATPWALYFGEFFNSHGQGQKVTDLAKKASIEFKTLPSSELERFQKQALENAKRNQEVHKKWLNSHTPQQIHEANRARLTLKRKLTAYRKSKLQDSRLVKAPRSSFLLFFMEKRGSLEGTLSEQAKKASQEWKTLSTAQKQKYVDTARQEQQRYFKEYKSLYGTEPNAAKGGVE